MSFKVFKVDLSVNFVNFISGELKSLKNDYSKIVFVSANKRPIRFIEKSIDIDTALSCEFYTLEEIARQIVATYSENVPIFHTKIEREIMFLDLIKGEKSLYQKIGLDDANLFLWAKRLAALFDEVDRQLLEKNLKNFQYVEALPEAVSILESLKSLYTKYRQLYENVTYSGDILKRAAKLTSESKFKDDYKNALFIFAGLVYLSNSEKNILKNIGDFADINFYVQTDLMQREAEFEEFETFKVVDNLVRWFKKSFNHLEENEIKPFSYKPVRFTFLQSADTHGEAGQAAKIIIDKYRLFENKTSSNNLAVILPDPKTLYPLLNMLGSEDMSLNISMGLGLKSTETGVFFEALFGLLIDIERKQSIGIPHSSDSKVFLRFLNTGLISLFYDDIIGEANSIKNEIIKSGKSVYQIDINGKIYSRVLKPFLECKNIKSLEAAFTSLFSNLDPDKLKLESAALTLQVLKHFYFEVVNSLKLIAEERAGDLNFFYKLLGEVMNDIIIPYEGHPLQGVQIMGVLEARLLTFDNIIIADVNEGILPAGDKIDPLLPESLKVELGLTSFKEKEMLMKYNFFRLVYSAKETFVLFKSGTSGNDKFVRSRFVEQLIFIKEKEEKKPLQIENKTFSVPEFQKNENFISRSELCDEHFKNVKYFSPSALNTYMRCPYSYYLKYIKNVPESVSFDRDFEADTLGSLVHKYFEVHFGKILGKSADKDLLEFVKAGILSDIDLLPEFNYEDSENKVRNFIDGLSRFQLEGLKIILVKRVTDYFEKIKNQDEGFKVIGTEKDIFDYGLKLKGRMDRIDELPGGAIRVVDFKTGLGKNMPFPRKLEKLIDEFAEIREIYDDKSLEKVRDSLNSVQMPCYILLAKKVYKKEVVSEIHYIGKKESDCIESLSDENIENYKMLINYIMQHMINSEKIYALANEKTCKYCEYESFCKFSV
jgi:CRISPR/Cas system-associated exonuclease Cas4 (RecB family)